jgi:hypothetical protein
VSNQLSRQATQTEPAGPLSSSGEGESVPTAGYHKAHRSLEVGTGLNPRVGACNAPRKALSPTLGKKCGRREREAGAGSEEERSSPAPDAAAVEGTQVHGVGDFLRGKSQERGPRSVRSTWCRVSSLHCGAPTTAGVLWKKEEGNVVSVRQAYALDSDRHGQTVTTAARGHVLHSVQRPVHVNRH